MAKKNKSGKTSEKKTRLDSRARQARTTRIVIIVISVVLILSWVLSLVKL
jgi:uncharacterized membrane protein